MDFSDLLASMAAPNQYERHLRAILMQLGASMKKPFKLEQKYIDQLKADFASDNEHFKYGLVTRPGKSGDGCEYAIVDARTKKGRDLSRKWAEANR